MSKQVLISEADEGQIFEGPIFVVSSKTAMGKTGKEYLSAIVADKSGEYDLKAWDNFGPYLSIFSKSSFLMVKARIGSFQSKKQLVLLEAKKILEESIPWEHFRMEAPKDLQANWDSLNQILSTLKSPHWKTFVQALWKEKDVEKRFKIYPAAKSVHHHGPSGLLIHCLSILRMCDFLCQHYRHYKVNRDLVIMGGLLHDIGKLFELSYDFRTEYTLEGQLVGHIVMGVELVEKICLQINCVPENEKLLLKHIILSHHGSLEYGSPKLPHTLEAFLVHFVDHMDSKMETAHNHSEKDMSDDGWTGYNRFLERNIYSNSADKTIYSHSDMKTESKCSENASLGDVLKKALKDSFDSN